MTERLGHLDISRRAATGERPGTSGIPATFVPRPAAVLVPLIAREGGVTVLLTRRTDHLRNHAGQISFPGGRVDAIDTDPIATALRETREEIGIGPDSIRVLGRLPQHFTGTGFVITPVVGLLYPPLTFVPDPDEVAEIFEVPLGVLMDPEGHKPESHVVNGIDRHYFAIYHEHRRIWGATARILIELSHILADAQPD